MVKKGSNTFFNDYKEFSQKDISKNAIHFNHFSLIILYLGKYLSKRQGFFCKNDNF